MGLPRTRSLRDVVLILLGATTMHLASVFMGYQEPPNSIIVSTQVSSHFMEEFNASLSGQNELEDTNSPKERVEQAVLEKGGGIPTVDLAYDFPETTIVSQAPGWTVFRNLYMSNGTLFIVSSHPASSFPDIMFMTSTGLSAENTPENIAARMPTADEMDFLTPTEARQLWGGDPTVGERNRLWPVQGNTVLVNEPPQFLDHYYHFCAELLFGAWAFWSGAFNAVVDSSSAGVTTAPSFDRMIFSHADTLGWRDRPGFNAYFLRAAFPSITVETETDWEDRIAATASNNPARAWHFDTVLLTDRSAAFRGEACGSRTQRIAGEALEHAQKVGTLAKYWWEPVRRSVLRFAGVGERTMDIGVRVDAAASARGRTSPQQHAANAAPLDTPVVVTYVSRQGSRRHLIGADHVALVDALTEMCKSHGWELNVMQAERITKEEQLEIVARTTVLIGVHGNGLSHLIMMPVTPISTIIEIFYPQGFAHDYEWTASALGMRHVAVWNDTYHTYPEQLWPNYPEGFQGTQIPVYAPTVVQVVQDRIAGRIP
ncbi:uncharacterized protein LAESUDRAFT_809546 [Laetiporus sulphureus 93-53]|uniref:Glycosyltransferase 61 catalytic domain-containing protein n=1 Tax=Laetiporus sulphureus 93-53 TaxID=1314785 RepID=A0A165GNI0_9APHY|nr:uncharacterized protein LAESUDRAFT_809546 [Laetiporus sulphureus 93-53]KZT10592.1 hypothetical protein LAESUDRAFT_809546 [Laetiporus sulphureus 93-53]